MTEPIPSPDRLPPRSTALIALAIFVPLCAAILWLAFGYRVVGPPSMYRNVPEGMLFAPAAVVLAIFAAGGPAVVLALFLANRHRLRAVFRQTRGRWITALVFALLAPVWNLQGVPLTAWMTIFAGFGVFLVLVLTLAWYPVSALIISGVKDKLLRLLVFALCWWSAYSWMMLILGSRYPAL